MAAYSWYTSCLTPYDEMLHKGRKVDIIDGEKRTLALKPYVLIGDEVESGRVEKRTFHPVTDRATAVNIHMYQSERRDSLFPNDPTCQLAATIRLDLGEDSTAMGSRNRPIDVYMTFGSSSLRVSARDEHMNKEVDIALTYLDPTGVRG